MRGYVRCYYKNCDSVGKAKHTGKQKLIHISVCHQRRYIESDPICAKCVDWVGSIKKSDYCICPHCDTMVVRMGKCSNCRSKLEV